MDQLTKLEHVRSKLRQIEQGEDAYSFGIQNCDFLQPRCAASQPQRMKPVEPSVKFPKVREALEYVQRLRGVTSSSPEPLRSSKHYQMQAKQVVMRESCERLSTCLEGATLSTLSAALRRRIRRLPKPDEEEQKKVEAYHRQFEELMTATDVVDLEHPRSVYRALKKRVNSGREALSVVKRPKYSQPESSDTVYPVGASLHPLIVTKSIVANCAPRVEKADDVAPKTEQEKLASELKSSKEAVGRIDRNVRATLDEVTAFLGFGGPTVEQRQLNHEGAQKLMGVLRGIALRRLSQTWTIWRKVVAEIARLRMLACVDKVQRAWRCRYSREELEMRKKTVLLRQRKATLAMSQTISHRTKAALTIQTTFRRHSCKLQVALERQRHWAAITVQCGWRRLLANRKLSRLRRIKADLLKCTIMAQSMARGHRARVRLRLLHKIQAVELAKAERVAAEAQVENRFARQGACITLQRWWRRVARLLLTRAMLSVVRRKKVINIQAWWRGANLRRHQRHERELYSARQKELAAAGLLLQTLYRRKLAKQRVAALHAEKKTPKPMYKARNSKALKVFSHVRNLRSKWDPLYKAKEQRCARDIQRVFRGYRARKRTKAMEITRILFRLKQRNRAAWLIQLQWRKYARRRSVEQRRRELAASSIQALVRRRWARRHFEKLLGFDYAAKTIQIAYRGYRTRLWFRGMREEWRMKNTAAVQIQSFWRCCMAREIAFKAMERERSREEDNLKGRGEAEKARERRRQLEVESSLEFGLQSNGPVQEIFREFTNPPKGLLSLEQLVRMFRMRVQRKVIEPVFSKVKAPGQQALTFPQFKQTLYDISKDTNKNASLVVIDLLLHQEWAHTINTALDASAKEQMHSAAARIQAFFRAFWMKKLFVSTKRALIEAKAERQKCILATKIQAQWRRQLARRHMLSLLEGVIAKYIDPDSGEAYWHNTRTGESSWEKPSILGSDDVQSSVALPDADEEFIVNCANCEDADAQLLCLDCKKPFCEDCFRVQHLKGNALRHTTQFIEPCADCGYQASSRKCETCDTNCCCKCFQELHGLHAHRSSQIVVQCSECDLRAARFRCDVCEDDLCIKCFNQLHAKGKKRLHPYTTLRYLTIELDKRMREEEHQLRLQTAQAEVERLQKERQQIRMETAIVQLQARWRGAQARREGLAYLKQERRRLRMAYVTEKKDRAAKRRVSYAVKALIGKAPILASDSEAEKERKQHGWKGTTWGAALLRTGAVPAMPVPKQLDGVARVEAGHPELVIYEDVPEEALRSGDWVRVKTKMYQVVSLRKAMERQKTTTIVTVDVPMDGAAAEAGEFVHIFNFGQLSAVQRGK